MNVEGTKRPQYTRGDQVTAGGEKWRIESTFGFGGLRLSRKEGKRIHFVNRSVLSVNGTPKDGPLENVDVV